MSKRHLFKLNSRPFYFGVQDSPSVLDFPHSLPITLMFKKGIGLITQKSDPRVDLWVKKAYDFNSSLSTPLGEGTFGRERLLDVISALHQSIGSKGFKGRTFLEVGCNKGHLLYLLKQRGAAYCLGVDPYPAAYAGAEKSGIEIIQNFFKPGAVNKKFDAVFTHGVLEHIKDPLSFLQGLKSCVKDGGILFTAVPDCGPGLLIGDLALPVHEHYNYFTAGSLRSLYHASGLESVGHRSASSSWMLYMWSRVRQNAAGTGRFIADEEGLFSNYCRAYMKIAGRVQAMINRLEREGRQIGIYGANCEFMMFKWKKPPRFFDSDRVKHARFLPGCANRIEGPDSLARSPVDSIWIAPINHDSAIRDFLKSRLKLPADKIVSMKEIYEDIAHLPSDT